MLTAVHFDHQTPLQADEVDDEPAYGLLSPELVPVYLTAAEVSPKSPLGVGGLPSELAGPFD